jgi:hypothetical protein
VLDAGQSRLEVIPLYPMGPPGTSARPLLLHTTQAFISCKFSLDAEC